MSLERQNELQKQSQQLLDGPLKHVRAAALAAALLPLASVAATPASAQEAGCASMSGGLCGLVFNDTNNNGVQDAGETGISGAVVTLVTPEGQLVTYTNSSGFYYFGLPLPPGTGTELNGYVIEVQIPPGTEPSPANSTLVDDTLDSDGVTDGLGNSVASVVFAGGGDSNTDFGFHQLPVTAPGTGTPGYWKTHPEAWPVPGLTVGGV